MGRHETFDSAIPLATDLLASTILGRTLPPDPVDAAIERHRAAWGDLQRATDAVDAAMSAAKQVEAEARADAAFDAASAADGAAWADLLATRPRDVPGAVRLLRYVSSSPETEVVPDPQDLLRQLTAAVEAAEAGERVECGAVEAEPALGVEPDPALAAAAEFRATWEALAAAIEAAGGAEVPVEIEDAEGAAYDRLKTVRPTTPEGFRALAEAWAVVLRGERGDGPATYHADHAADSLIAGAGVCVPSAPVRDWQAFAAGHPGFVPYPPHAPVLLIALDEAIPREAERLLDLAEAEIARSRASFARYPDPDLWPQVERTMRRELRTDALKLVVAPLPKDDGAPDPVHALIEAHRSAYAAWDRASKVWTGMVPGEPGYTAAQAAADGPEAAERAAYRRLFSTRPTTLAGAVALASYLGEAIRRTRVDPEPTEGERALSAITAALYGLAPGGAFSGDAPVTVAAPHPDEALFALGAKFLGAWVAEARIGDEASYEAVTAITTRILAAPVATVAGLGIQALLLARLAHGDSSPLDPEPPQGPPGSTWNVLRQVQEGTARLAGAVPEPLSPAQLVAAIEAEWAAYAAAEATEAGADEAAMERRDALIDAADALAATSAEARHAKALALAWIVAVDQRGSAARGEIATDGRLAVDLHAALARLAPPQAQDAGEIPTALAAACAWAVAREAQINAPRGTDGMSEVQLDAALKACDGVWDRAIAEPSTSSADVAAKARLLLPDAERRARSADACRDDRLVPVILREIAGLGDAS